MAYSTPYHYLTFGGPYGASEQWSVGLKMATSGTARTQEDEQTILTAMQATLTTQWNLESNPVGNSAALAWVKYNLVGTNGKYVNNWTSVKDFAPVLSGTQGPYPFQIALVATLQTDAARGLASKGRIFLPCPRYPIDGADRRISSANALAAATWVAGLITAVNDVPNVGSVYVFSAGGNRNGVLTPGTRRLVNAVSVGTVLDTMRSRRTNLVEQRSVAPVQGVAVGGDF